MRSALAQLGQRMQRLQSEGLYRSLSAGSGVDFVTNDYLGISRHPGFRARLQQRLAGDGADAPVGAPASRLLCGHTTQHHRLEDRLAQFKGTESALLFPNGYTANMGLLSALLQDGDRIISDAQNHASIIDGIRLARGVHKVVLPHLQVEALEKTLRQPHPGGQTYVVTESIFSMDGDIAPLGRYVELCEQFDAGLLIDDAHATGVFGDARRSGLTEGLAHRALAIVSTFGKALGCFGAFVAGPAVVRELLINQARPFIFTTAHPPMLLHAINAALDTLAADPTLGAQALARAGSLRQLLQAAALDTLDSAGPIVPVVIGDNRRALEVAEQVRTAGFDVRAVRPPTVAPGTARLRLSVHADHTEQHVRGLAAAITAALRHDRKHDNERATG